MSQVHWLDANKTDFHRASIAEPLPVQLCSNAGAAIDTTQPAQVYQSNTYANLVANGTTVVKSGAGTLARIIINTIAAAATITIYDNTAASGTKIATIVLPAAGAGDMPDSLMYDCAFGTGLTIVTSGATDITVVFR